jgi:hypothetical protein
MNTAEADSKAKSFLEKLIRTLNNARTLYYEGRKLHPNPTAGQADNQANDKAPITQQKYFLQNEGGLTRIRVESSATIFGMSITTTFIKNEDGIWEVLTDQVCEVSKIFTTDQLLGVFPFRRLLPCLQHPYELHLSEEKRGDVQCWVIAGKSSGAPGENGQDLAGEFTYKIGQADGLLYSLNEMTFGKRFNDLELDKFELDHPLDPALFDLSDKPRIILSTLEEWTELRNQEMTKRLRSS